MRFAVIAELRTIRTVGVKANDHACAGVIRVQNHDQGRHVGWAGGQDLSAGDRRVVSLCRLGGGRAATEIKAMTRTFSALSCSIDAMQFGGRGPSLRLDN